MKNHHVVVIGAGSTGAAIAYDLALRGLKVTLIERFGPAACENTDSPAVRAQVEDRDGVWRCHGVYECTEVCPAGVEPASAIGHLRIDLIVSMIKRKGN